MSKPLKSTILIVISIALLCTIAAIVAIKVPFKTRIIHIDMCNDHGQTHFSVIQGESDDFNNAAATDYYYKNSLADCFAGTDVKIKLYLL